MNEKTLRLQKYLAEQGVASRRNSADIIKSGRITVNGKQAIEPAFPVTPDKDKILVDGKPLPNRKIKHRTIMMYKPRGYICSTSEEQGETVFALIPEIRERLLPIGRLDKNSEGLLLLSNDGDLINRLTHPRYNHEKEYHVTVSGEVNDKILQEMRKPITLDGYTTLPAKVRLLRPSEKENRNILNFILNEGRKRQIRHLCERSGLKIHRLIRVRIDKWNVRGMKPGDWRDVEIPVLS